MSVQTQRETRDTKEGEFKRDLRTNLLLCSRTSENRVPTVVSLGMVATVLFVFFKSSLNRFRRFETSFCVNSFRFVFLEFVPIPLPVFAFAPFTSALNIVILFRKREKRTREKTFPLCLLRAGRERHAFAVPSHAWRDDIARGCIFPKNGANWKSNFSPFCDTQTHTETHIIIMQIFVKTREYS